MFLRSVSTHALLLFPLFGAVAFGAERSQWVKLQDLPAKPQVIRLKLQRQPDDANTSVKLRFVWPDSAEHQELLLQNGVARVLGGRARNGLRQTGFTLPQGGRFTLQLIRRGDRLIVDSGQDVLRLALQSAEACRLLGQTTGCLFRRARRQIVEPVNFYDSFSWDGDSGPWRTVAGRWERDFIHDPLLKRDGHPPRAARFASAAPERCLAMAGRNFYSHYRVRAVVKLTKKAHAGLAVGVQDDGRCSAVILHRGRVTVANHTAAGEDVVASIPHDDVRTGQWLALEARYSPGWVEAWLFDRCVWRGPVDTAALGRFGVIASGGRALFDDVAVRNWDALTFTANLAWLGQPTCQSARTGRWRLTWGPGAPDTGGDGTLVLRTGTPALHLVRGRDALQIANGAPLLKAEPLEAGQSTTVEVVGPRLQWWTAGQKQGEHVMDAPCPPPSCRRLFALANQGAAGAYLQIGPAELDRPVTVWHSDLETRTVRGGIGGGKGQRTIVLGEQLVPCGGQWNHKTDDGGRIEVDCSGTARAGYYRAVPGNAAIRATLAPGRRACRGVFLAADDAFKGGYALTAEGRKLVLSREGRPVRTVTLDAAPQTVMLARSGDVLLGHADDEAVLHWRDPQPLPGVACGLISEDDGAFEAVTVGHLDGSVHLFDRSDPRWRPLRGRWQLNTGMACIPWSHWVGAEPADDSGLALALRRQPLDAPALDLRVNVSEATDGFDDGDHCHYPYHDLHVGLTDAEGSWDDGWLLIVGAQGGEGGAQLYHRGRKVADDPTFRLRFGGHCNNIRSVHIHLRIEGRQVQVSLNGRESIRYRADQAVDLNGRHVLIGNAKCRANFNDIVVLPYHPAAGRTR